MTKLSKKEKLAVSILNAAPFNIATSIKLRNKGVYSVSQTISRLIAKGAIIAVVKKPAYDNVGELHNNIAHYRFEGWM